MIFASFFPFFFWGREIESQRSKVFQLMISSPFLGRFSLFHTPGLRILPLTRVKNCFCLPYIFTSISFLFVSRDKITFCKLFIFTHKKNRPSFSTKDVFFQLWKQDILSYMEWVDNNSVRLLKTYQYWQTCTIRSNRRRDRSRRRLSLAVCDVKGSGRVFLMRVFKFVGVKFTSGRRRVCLISSLVVWTPPVNVYFIHCCKDQSIYEVLETSKVNFHLKFEMIAKKVSKLNWLLKTKQHK